MPRSWLVAWILLFVAINLCDLGTLTGRFEPAEIYFTIFKVSSVILCFVYTVLYFPRDRLLQASMLATCLADIVLAINNTLVAGVEIFLVAQVLHLARLEWPRLEQPIVTVSLLAAICIILDCMFPIIPPMYLICFFYVIAIISNLLASWRWCVLEPHSLRARLCFGGFVLFLFCDICTGLSYLSLNQILPAYLYLPANFFAWFFYFPSQVLLANSSKQAASSKTIPTRATTRAD